VSVSTVPVPQFVARDPEVIAREMVAAYEASTGRVLHPAQVERLLIDVMAYRETLVRIAIQEASLQNLVAFAGFPMLDYLGELVGTTRLPAQAAVTTLRFTLSAPQLVPIVIPAGTRVQTPDAAAVFSTRAELVIAAAAPFGDVPASAELAGVAANGLLAGAVSELLVPRAFVASVANTTATDGGADVEDDDRYRERIRQAPESFSTAGSAGAYRFHALTASSAVTDVAVTNPLMGVVRLYVLATTGLPSAALLAQVQLAVSGDRVRPLSDTVEVVAPIEVPYQITATVRPLMGVDVPALLASVRRAAEAYAAERRSSLGRDIVPSQIVAALSVPGTYSVVLASPAERVLGPEEWANCTLITINQGASAYG
jgi:phage-related baseplate assembly protein